MTVKELRDRLNTFIEEGYKDLPVLTYDLRNDAYRDMVDIDLYLGDELFNPHVGISIGDFYNLSKEDE